MKNGLYYTDGTFLVLVASEDGEEARELATHVVRFADDINVQSFPVSRYTHEELLEGSKPFADEDDNYPVPDCDFTNYDGMQEREY